MSKKAFIFFNIVFTFSIESIENNLFEPKNVLFAAEFNDSEEFILNSDSDYIRGNVCPSGLLKGGIVKTPPCEEIFGN